MASDDLKRNCLTSLQRTLVDLSCEERQRRYKNAVPFVHVPIELMEQLAGQVRMLRECHWYAEIFHDTDLYAIRGLNSVCSDYAGKVGARIADIPDIFLDQRWLEIVGQAKWLLTEISGTLDQFDDRENTY